MKLFLAKKIISGCELRGDGSKPYMTRYTLIETASWQLCIHVFHRSDWTDDLHDHPWNFISLLLWRGYIEETRKGKNRYWPGSILFRPAGYVHRVELVKGKKAITLVWMGRRKRLWGFWENRTKFLPFYDYFTKYKC